MCFACCCASLFKVRFLEDDLRHFNPSVRYVPACLSRKFNVTGLLKVLTKTFLYFSGARMNLRISWCSIQHYSDVLSVEVSNHSLDKFRCRLDV